MARLARALAVAAAFAAVAGAARVARATDPVIHVRARMRIDLDSVERINGGLLVRGSLRDDASEEPIAGRTVAISVEGDHGFYHYAEPTGPDGSFRWRVPLVLGDYHLHVGAGGDTDYLAPTAIDRDLAVTERMVTVTVQAPARISARAASIHVVVEAHEADGAGPPRAYIGSGSVDIGGRRDTHLEFVGGRAEADLFSPFGRAGQRVEVKAYIDPEDSHTSGSGRRMVLLTSPTTVSLTVDRDRVAPDELVGLAGMVRDDDGPIARADVAVGLENGPDLATFTTDAAGRFVGQLRGRDLPTGHAFVEARARPREEWREASVSATVPVEVLPSPPIAAWPYLVSPALTLLVVALVLAARDRRWRRWLAVRPRARRRRAAVPPPAAGLTESRRGILSSLRRPDYGFVGVVVDAIAHHPIATATLVARGANGDSRVAAVDEHGRFAIEELPPGELVVEIAAPGYVGERFTRTLPHRGELRGARVRLVPVRARIFDAWRRAAAPLYPTPRAAETMTPRELALYLEARRLIPSSSGALAALTALVESAVWGARPPSSDDLAEAERLAASLQADSQRPSPL